jgi:hypothetical protein
MHERNLSETSAIGLKLFVMCFAQMTAQNVEMSILSIVRERVDCVLFNNAHNADATGVDDSVATPTSLRVESSRCMVGKPNLTGLGKVCP